MQFRDVDKRKSTADLPAFNSWLNAGVKQISRRKISGVSLDLSTNGQDRIERSIRPAVVT